MEGNRNWMVLSTLLLILVGGCLGWGSEKVKLKDIQVLTLKHGAMTAGRRSSPVPQLKCVGGTARCEFAPKVVQCYNKGSDGYDVQKTDMDNAYRFGDISVTCEGYNYPDDPYVLKGSCGLEYTIDYTKEGMSDSSQHDYYRGEQSSDYGWKSSLYTPSKPKTDFITNLCCGAVVVVIVYGIYKTCISPGNQTAEQRSNTNDDYHGRGPGQSPPPPGFRSNYSSGNSGYSGADTGFGGDSCGSSSTKGTGSAGGWSRNAGGFWTGAAAGGLLGYMFGNRGNNTGGATYRARPSTSWGAGSSSGWGGGGSSFGSSSSSSGSRSASGFGGTSRR